MSLIRQVVTRFIYIIIQVESASMTTWKEWLNFVSIPGAAGVGC